MRQIKQALESIESAAKIDAETVIVNIFQARDYNRVNYTIAS